MQEDMDRISLRRNTIGLGGGGSCPPTAAEGSILANLNEQMARRTSDFLGTIENLEDLAKCLGLVVASGPRTQGNAPERSGHLGRLAELNDALGSLVSRLQDVTQVLRAGVS